MSKHIILHKEYCWYVYYADGISWLLQDASFEKMGALMAANDGRLLGLYDEMSSFLGKLTFAVEKEFVIHMNWLCFLSFIMQMHGQEVQVEIYMYK